MRVRVGTGVLLSALLLAGCPDSSKPLGASLRVSDVNTQQTFVLEDGWVECEGSTASTISFGTFKPDSGTVRLRVDVSMFVEPGADAPLDRAVSAEPGAEARVTATFEDRAGVGTAGVVTIKERHDGVSEHWLAVELRDVVVDDTTQAGFVAFLISGEIACGSGFYPATRALGGALVGRGEKHDRDPDRPSSSGGGLGD